MAVKSIRKLLQDVPRFLAIAKRVDALNSTTFKRVSELSDDPVLLKASSHLSRARILRSPSHTQTKINFDPNVSHHLTSRECTNESICVKTRHDRGWHGMTLATTAERV